MAGNLFRILKKKNNNSNNQDRIYAPAPGARAQGGKFSGAAY